VNVLPGNPFHSEALDSFAQQYDGNTQAILVAAFEQRTATLIAALALGRAPAGVAWPDWEAKIQAQLSGRLGIEL
jgi:hypothetical protein